MENRSGLDFSSCKVPSVMRVLALLTAARTQTQRTQCTCFSAPGDLDAKGRVLPAC